MFIFVVTGAAAIGGVFFFFFMYMAIAPAMIVPIRANPPITPPAIAPTGVFFVVLGLPIVPPLVLPLPPARTAVVEGALLAVLVVSAPPPLVIVLKTSTVPIEDVWNFEEPDGVS